MEYFEITAAILMFVAVFNIKNTSKFINKK